jgi:Flp pilus assembly protein TadD
MTGPTLSQLKAAHRANPNDPDAACSLASALVVTGDHAGAAKVLKRVLKLSPRNVNATIALAGVLREAGRFDEALRLLTKITAASGSDSSYWYLQGLLHRDAGHLRTAADAYRKAADLAPHRPEIYLNLGNVLTGLADYDGAVASYDRACDLRGAYPRARANKALALLLAGRFAEGWPLYRDARRAVVEQPDLSHLAAVPDWRGEDLTGKTLWVWGEQGIGDEIRFMSMLDDVARRARRVVYECAPRLAAMARRRFPDIAVVARPAGRAAPPPAPAFR